jgi:hypothetical protein
MFSLGIYSAYKQFYFYIKITEYSKHAVNLYIYYSRATATADSGIQFTASRKIKLEN